jgi:putative hydrolase of the HAD superfamily
MRTKASSLHTFSCDLVCGSGTSAGVEHARVIAFDFGETLAHYEGTALNWSEHYGAALERVTARCGFQLSPLGVDDAKGVLTRYNTRVTPREREVSCSVIMAEIFAAWQLDANELLDTASDAFFGYFRRALHVYQDTLPALERLRRRGFSLAVFTDVPYGMPKRFVEEDLARAGVLHLLDCLLTSVDVGRRKPDPAGLVQLAEFFSSPPARVAYVGNEPKDVEAAIRAGMRPILIDRTGGAHAHDGVTAIRSLVEVEHVLDSTPPS